MQQVDKQTLDEIAEFKYYALERIASLTDSPEDKKSLEEFRDYMIRYELGAGTIKRNLAIKCEKEGRHSDAQKIWEELYKDQSLKPKIRQEALSRIGYCLFELAKKAEKQGQKETATNLYEQAALKFNEHIDFIAKYNIPEKDVISDAGVSCGLLCLIYLEKQNKPAEVIKCSNQYLTRFQTHDPRHFISILRLRVKALIRLADLAGAEQEFKALKQKHKQTNAGLDDYTNSAGELSQAFEEKAKDLKESDPAQSKLFQRKSNDYYGIYLENPAISADVFTITRNRADSAFNSAKDEKNAEQRRQLFNQALKFYEELITKFEKETTAKNLTEYINWKIAQIYYELSNFDKALEKLGELTEDQEVLELKGDILMSKAKINNDKDLVGKALGYYGQVAEGLRRLQTEAYFRNLFKWASALYELGAYDRLKTWFVVQERTQPDDLDNDKWGYKTKFAELKSKVNEKVVFKK